MIKIIFFFFTCLFRLTAISQSLSGKWNGWSESKFLVTKPVTIKLELEQLTDSTFAGVLHLQYKKGKFEHTKVSGFLNKKNSTFLLTEDSTISYKLISFTSICLGKNRLKIRYSDSSIVMEGIWKDKSKALIRCPNIRDRYEKMFENIEKTKENRYNDVQKVIDVSKKFADSIKLELYDGGDIDNDSVNVFLNEIEVVKKLRLNSKPQVFYVNLNKEIEINKLIFQAINLGNIEPNTAYMLITVNKKEYSINLTSSFKKNGVVEFQFVDL